MSPSMAGRVIKATLGLNRDSHEAQQKWDGKPHPHPHPHPQVEDVVNTIGFALVQELMQYLKGHDGEQALESILDRQSRVVSRLVTTPEARHATRVAASEAIEGSYAAVQRQCAAACRGKSRMMLVVAIAVGFYVLLLAVGVLLTCWRFVFFGLR